MATLNAEHVHAVHFMSAQDEAPEAAPKRPVDQTTLKMFRKRMKSAKVSGHPANFFKPIFRLSGKITSEDKSYKYKYFRSFDAMQVEGGGVILQSSWLEDTCPALSFMYRPDLGLQEREYEDDDGERRVGYVVVHRPWWKRLFGLR